MKSVQCGISRHFFHVSRPFFTFHILRQGLHLREKSKDLVVNFFAALIKHKIRIKYEKCIVSDSYFVVCFAKYPRNAKYEKCIVGLRRLRFIEYGPKKLPINFFAKIGSQLVLLGNCKIDTTLQQVLRLS